MAGPRGQTAVAAGEACTRADSVVAGLEGADPGRRFSPLVSIELRVNKDGNADLEECVCHA